jgi:hypothetical protein
MAASHPNLDCLILLQQSRSTTEINCNYGRQLMLQRVSFNMDTRVLNFALEKIVSDRKNINSLSGYNTEVY